MCHQYHNNLIVLSLNTVIGESTTQLPGTPGMLSAVAGSPFCPVSPGKPDSPGGPYTNQTKPFVNR